MERLSKFQIKMERDPDRDGRMTRGVVTLSLVGGDLILHFYENEPVDGVVTRLRAFADLVEVVALQSRKTHAEQEGKKEGGTGGDRNRLS